VRIRLPHLKLYFPKTYFHLKYVGHFFLQFYLFHIYKTRASGFNYTPLICRHYTDRYSYSFLYYFLCFDYLGETEDNESTIIRGSCYPAEVRTTYPPEAGPDRYRCIKLVCNFMLNCQDFRELLRGTQLVQKFSALCITLFYLAPLDPTQSQLSFAPGRLFVRMHPDLDIGGRIIFSWILRRHRVQ
jgi:hypothetical protein